MATAGRVGVPSGDPDRTYTLDEEAQLTRNLHALTTAVHAGKFSHIRVGIQLLEVLHRNLFATVRSHAGRCRSRDFGSEHLTFGPHRSMHRNEVLDSLTEVFRSFVSEAGRLWANPAAEGYDEAALHLALRLHADVIRIHPFEDGNGRTGRALMDLVLVQLGLRPIPMEVPKEEYIEVLNHYYRTHDLNPLQDLALRLYPMYDSLGT